MTYKVFESIGKAYERVEGGWSLGSPGSFVGGGVGAYRDRDVRGAPEPERERLYMWGSPVDQCVVVLADRI